MRRKELETEGMEAARMIPGMMIPPQLPIRKITNRIINETEQERYKGDKMNG
jgi:hypothetical protein